MLDAIDFIAKAKINRESRSGAPVVLNKKRKSRRGDVPDEVARECDGPVWHAVEIGLQIPEPYRSLRIRRNIRGALQIQDLSTELESMFAVQIRDVIEYLQNAIRSYN